MKSFILEKTRSHFIQEPYSSLLVDGGKQELAGLVIDDGLIACIIAPLFHHGAVRAVLLVLRVDRVNQWVPRVESDSTRKALHHTPFECIESFNLWQEEPLSREF